MKNLKDPQRTNEQWIFYSNVQLFLFLNNVRLLWGNCLPKSEWSSTFFFVRWNIEISFLNYKKCYVRFCINEKTNFIFQESFANKLKGFVVKCSCFTISIIFSAPGWLRIWPKATSCRKRLCSSRMVCLSAHVTPPAPVGSR